MLREDQERGTNESEGATLTIGPASDFPLWPVLLTGLTGWLRLGPEQEEASQ